MDETIASLREDIVKPFVEAICCEARTTLVGVITCTSDVARSAVQGVLRREEERFAERKFDGEASSMQLASALALLSNLLAVEGALESIQKHLGI